MTWDATIQNGLETQCRGAIAQVPSGTSLYLNLDSGKATSDQNNLISFTSFSLSNVMSDDALSRFVYAVAPSSPKQVNNTLTPIPMVTEITGASTQFNAATATYTCGSTGPHFVSASVGVLGNMPTQVMITNPMLPIGLTRTTTLYNNVTTLSRNTIIQCEAGQTISLDLLSGTVANSDGVNKYNLTTFSVIPYEPRNATPVVWALNKNYIAFNNQGGQGILNPFFYPNVSINVGNAYNPNSRTVTIPVAGCYYIYISSGAGVGMNGDTFTYQLMSGPTSGTQTLLFGIEHLSSAQGATDMFGRGQVVCLPAGQVLSVVAQVPSYIYSSVTGYETSWFGMLLYTQ